MEQHRLTQSGACGTFVEHYESVNELVSALGTRINSVGTL